MGFELTITRGLEVGRSFAFDQPEVTVGRATEGDVVLQEAGVSRTHARILAEGGRCFVEDLGSANGTKVNGLRTAGRHELKSGDVITVGPVSFEFSVVQATRLVGALAAPAGDSTRMVDPAEIARKAEAKRRERARSMADIADERTVALPDEEDAADRTDPGAGRPTDGATGQKVRVDPNVTQPKAQPPARDENATRIKDAPARPAKGSSGAPAPPSAAERSRRRRRYGDSLGGQLQFLWAQLSPRGKAVAGSTVAAISLAIVLGLGGLFWPEDTGPRLPDEPGELGSKPVPFSFGLGEGVDYERDDMKIFRFRFATPTRAVAVLRYMSRDIQPDEVSVVVNGSEQGKLPPDTEDSFEHELQLVLSGSALKRNELNTVTFDNVKNPPGEDPWRIWNVSLEVVPVPELPDPELLASAREYADRGRNLFERRDVGPDNLFRAWKSYRQSWITLEALRDKPELYQVVRHQLATIGKELDQHCNRLMLEAEKSLRLRQRKKARQTLESVERYFPTTEHRCHNLAIARLSEHEL